jgi:hypothetical protein
MSSTHVDNSHDVGAWVHAFELGGVVSMHSLDLQARYNSLQCASQLMYIDRGLDTHCFGLLHENRLTCITKELPMAIKMRPVLFKGAFDMSKITLSPSMGHLVTRKISAVMAPTQVLQQELGLALKGKKVRRPFTLLKIDPKVKVDDKVETKAQTQTQSHTQAKVFSPLEVSYLQLLEFSLKHR